MVRSPFIREPNPVNIVSAIHPVRPYIKNLVFILIFSACKKNKFEVNATLNYIYLVNYSFSSSRAGSSNISFSPFPIIISGTPTLPSFLISSNSGLISLSFRYIFRFRILSVISMYSNWIPLFERNSFIGSQSGQCLLPNTVIFFIACLLNMYIINLRSYQLSQPHNLLINLSRYTDLSCLLAIACFIGGSFSIADKTAAIALWLPKA